LSHKPPTPQISLIVPTYNEADNLEPLVSGLLETFRAKGRQHFEIIVVDDDSPDGTGGLAHKLAAEHAGIVRVVHRTSPRGLATAVLAGWQVARAPVLAVMDADGQHPASLPLRLLHAVEQRADVAIASRYSPGGETPDWNPVRRILSHGARLLARLTLPGVVAGIHDPLSGCFALRRAVIADKKLRPLGYKILLEVLARGEFRSVEEVPYSFADRQAGRSKASVRQLILYVLHTLQLAWATKHVHRLARFCFVGVSGMGVNLGLLAAVRELSPLPLGLAGALAVLGAVLSNFLLNEFWTFADWSRLRPGWQQRLRRLAQFVIICAGGGVANLATLLLLVRLAGLHYLLAGGAGIVVAVFWNYGWNANLTWKPAPLPGA
jgi:dolichol-phosphate mannosyltransferase